MSSDILILGHSVLALDLPAVFLDFNVKVEETFEGAMDALGRGPQDAIVLGLDFDYGRAFRILRHVREHEQFTPIPVLVVDADGRTARVAVPAALYYDQGADDFLDLYSSIRLDGRDQALMRLRNRVLLLLTAPRRIPRTGREIFADASSSQNEPAYLGSALRRVGLGGLFARCRRCRSEHFASPEPAEPVTHQSALICAICEAVTTQGELIVQIGNEALALARARLDSVGC